MQRDGDVWQAIWRAIIAKGPHAIKVSKVKGHATEQHVRDGTATAETKEGNDIADKLVEEGTTLHGKANVDLAYWLGARQRAYQTTMPDIQRFIPNSR